MVRLCVAPGGRRVLQYNYYLSPTPSYLTMVFTSLTVAMLVTVIAFWHYLYMTDYFFATGNSPIVLRYVDRLITVPLQILVFYLILAAVTTVSKSLFWQLLVSSLVMLVGGFLG